MPSKSVVTKSVASIVVLLISAAGFGRVSLTQGQMGDRITGAIDERSRAIVQGHLHPMAQSQLDQGRLNPRSELNRVTMMFKRTEAQQVALQSLLEEQQDPSSTNYHRWLSPEEFGDRFGLSAADVDRIAGWLRAQGLIINESARSRSWIAFSGTVRQLEAAFRTQLHEYLVNGSRNYAAAVEPSVPTALGNVVLGFRALDNFRLKPRVKARKVDFTSTVTGNHFLTPDDVATIYDVRDLYSTGIDGTGQKIAVMGQTDIVSSDIATFRSVSGLPASDPTVILVPDSGDPGIDANEIIEADLDLEWAGAVAPKADLIYVNPGNGVFDSLAYTVDQNLAPVVSISYGDCERNFSASDINFLSALGQQANAQGITIVAPTGDAGATDCDGNFPNRGVARMGLAVDAPASLPYVTAAGGSTLYDVGNYWNSANNGNSGSALSYIPEVAWNDTLVFRESGLIAGGGGRSIYFAKPSWQSGLGVPNDHTRDTPDISFSASDHDAYLICSTGSCVNGFRASDASLFGVSGTSLSAPIFAGIVSLINQRMAAAQGNVNRGLYQVARYASNAFHDITSGGNWMPCQAGTRDCLRGGLLGYAAGRGYDLATGLGSVDAFKLVNDWPSVK
jgi:subtilase family serine protease